MSSPSESVNWKHRLITRYYRAQEHPARLRIIHWLQRLLGVPAPRVEVAAGVVMELDEEEYVQRQILLHGGYELETLPLFRRLCAQARNFCDVGAHVGQYTLLAARTLAGRGRVYAFEPSPANAARLLRNAALSNLHNIELFACALGAEPSMACITSVDTKTATSNAQLTDMAAAGRLLTRVAIKTFSEIAPHLPADGFDFLKIDVEGYEARVLAGLFASPLPRPRDILLEFNPGVFDYGIAPSLPDWLAQHRYDLRRVDGEPYAANGPLPNDNLWATRRE